jgi:hypothetical protein
MPGKLKPPKPPKISPSGLKYRGWTPALIKQFLGEPDATAVNPHYRSGPRMQLYLLERVEKAEASPGFQEALTKARTRQKSAEKAVQTRTERTVALARQLEITVEKIPLSMLKKLAVEHWLAHKIERGWYEERPRLEPWGRPDPFRDRICVNFLRHQASEYETNLTIVAGKTGIAEAYHIFWTQLSAAIKQAYPVLAEEVDRQFTERFGPETQNKSDL